MSKNEIVSLIETMNNYDALAAKAKAKADAIREAIKEEMVRQGREELTAGAYIIRYTSVISNRFDSTTFKRLYADLYQDFTKPVSSRPLHGVLLKETCSTGQGWPVEQWEVQRFVKVLFYEHQKQGGLRSPGRQALNTNRRPPGIRTFSPGGGNEQEDKGTDHGGIPGNHSDNAGRVLRLPSQ